MNQYRLRITLDSATTFGRGDGVAGLVDAEVQHDAVGLPYLGGRSLKGLLFAECDDVVGALDAGGNDPEGRWAAAARRLFGVSGAGLEGAGRLHIGPARLPEELRTALVYDVAVGTLTRAEVLETLTAVRRQTAVDESGAPRGETLRTIRVILRDLTFTAALTFTAKPDSDDLALLAATAKALRRVGTGRNRGRGKVHARLWTVDGDDVTDTLFSDFSREVHT